MNSLQKNLAAEVLALNGGGGRLVAAGAGDNTKITGQTIDRGGASGSQMYQSCIVNVGWHANLGATKSLSLANEMQDSADGSNWNAAVPLYTSTIVATSAGGGDVYGTTQSNIDLSKNARFIRFNPTPDLSNTSTDTAEVMQQVTLAGGNTLPAN